MDIFLLIVGFLLAITGIIGSILPVLPGPILGWFGLVLLYLTKIVPVNYTLLGITLVVSIVVLALDYIIPSVGTKKFGGTKFGVIGTTIGLILGMFFFPPIGLIVGPFVGAFVGEMMYDSKNPKKALKASYGSFIGFLTGTFLKFVVSVIFTGLYFSIFWEYKAAFFNF